MSPGVIRVRTDICEDCPTPCVWQRDGAAHANPCAACPLPRPRWGKWGCKSGQPTPAPAASLPAAGGVTAPPSGPASRAPAKTLEEKLAKMRAAGHLADDATQEARRAACAACTHRRPTPHPGYYLCAHPNATCACAGGYELRLALDATLCPAGSWPKG